MYNLLNYWKWKHMNEASVTISLTQYCKLLSKIELLESERERTVVKSKLLPMKLSSKRTLLLVD